MSDETTNEGSTPGTPTTTFEEYVARVSERLRERPYWRQGQAAFNVLYEVYPKLANDINTTLRDPFYRDDRLPEFYEFVEENWE